MMVDGGFILQHHDTDYAVVGGAIAYNLQMNMQDPFSYLEIYAPRRKAASLLQPEEAFNQRMITPSGVFAIQQEFDAKYILVSKDFAKEIFEFDDQLTGVEVVTDQNKDLDAITNQLRTLLGPDFVLKDRYEQHATIYKIMKSEKWAVFLILTFILIIATFNVISSLTMLVIDKKKDVAILSSMGANKKMIRRIFLIEGFFITIAGAVGGLLLGSGICFLQLHFGLIELGGSGSFIIDAYPVKMILKDFLSVLLTVTFIGMIAAWYPGWRLIGDQVNLKVIAGDND